MPAIKLETLPILAAADQIPGTTWQCRLHDYTNDCHELMTRNSGINCMSSGTVGTGTDQFYFFKIGQTLLCMYVITPRNVRCLRFQFKWHCLAVWTVDISTELFTLRTIKYHNAICVRSPKLSTFAQIHFLRFWFRGRHPIK